MTPLSPSTLHTLAMGSAFGISDIGTVRSSNQDNFLILPDLGLVAVADGMGGHAGGDIASTQALLMIAEQLRLLAPPHADPDATWTAAANRALHELQAAVERVNAQLYEVNVSAGLPDGYGMGTTLSGMWQADPAGPAYIFHVGDSRIYRYRDGVLAQLTHDQTLYQQALEMGASEPLPPRNLLLQALGPGKDVRPDVFVQTLSPGDVYLLCSDGLYGESAAAIISALLDQATTPAMLQQCCEGLIAMAKQDRSRDNITALILRCPD